MLFKKHHNHRRHQSHTRGPAGRGPRGPHLRTPRVTCFCREHDFPVKKVHIGDAPSRHGNPAAIYACSVCNEREAWVFDFRTGKPYQLWFGKAR